MKLARVFLKQNIIKIFFLTSFEGTLLLKILKIYKYFY